MDAMSRLLWISKVLLLFLTTQPPTVRSFALSANHGKFIDTKIKMPTYSGRILSHMLRITGSAENVQHSRRSTLEGLTKAAFWTISLNFAAQPACCRVTRSSDGGRWANHFGEFAEEELSGFEITSSGLKFKDVVVGEGAVPAKGQSATVHYAGYLAEDGAKFDASYERGKPLSFHVGAGEVIKGWDEAITAMRVGGRRIIIVPPALGYGERGAGGGLIPPGATLVFYMELLSVGP